MKGYLLDTSVFIDFLRRPDKSNSPLVHLAREQLFLSVVVFAELYAGQSIWEKQDIYRDVEAMLSVVTTLPFTQKIAITGGRFKADHPIPSLIDCIIAATALEYDLELVTLNRKHFKMIPGLKLFSPNA